MPQIVLSAAGQNDFSKVDPGFANQICLFVVVED
jgi:hypothetical protein